MPTDVMTAEAIRQARELVSSALPSELQELLAVLDDVELAHSDDVRCQTAIQQTRLALDQLTIALIRAALSRSARNGERREGHRSPVGSFRR